MFSYLHNTIPNSIIFSIGSVSIHWYGFCIALGVLLGTLAVVRLSQRYGIAEKHVYDFLFWAVIGGVLGARLYYVLYNWQYYQDHLFEIPLFWEGGLAIHGALLGGALVLIGYTKKHKINTLAFLDVAVVGVVIGQIAGRWGNYFNQEIFGYPTSLPWGIPISENRRPEQFLEATHFHPIFLYESLLNLMLLGVLLVLHRYKARNTNLAHGILGMIYFVGYGIIRFAMEQFRVDYSPTVFGVRWAVLFSLFLLCTGICASIYLIWKQKKHNQLSK